MLETLWGSLHTCCRLGGSWYLVIPENIRVSQNNHRMSMHRDLGEPRVGTPCPDMSRTFLISALKSCVLGYSATTPCPTPQPPPSTVQSTRGQLATLQTVPVLKMGSRARNCLAGSIWPGCSRTVFNVDPSLGQRSHTARLQSEQDPHPHVSLQGGEVTLDSFHLLVSDLQLFSVNSIIFNLQKCGQQETSGYFLFNETQFDYKSSESPGGQFFSGGF